MISRRLLRIKVVKALYSHMQTEGQSLITSQKNLMFSINKSYELYHLMMFLVVEVARYAEQVIEQRKSKLLPTQEDLTPNCRFINNKVVEQLRKSVALNGYLTKNSLSWSNNSDVIKKLYNNMTQRDYYKSYTTSNHCGYSEDKALVIDFLMNEIEDFEDIYDAIEDMSIFWIDDLEFVTSQAINSIRKFKPSSILTDSNSDIYIMPIVKDPDDIAFAKELFARSLVDHNENLSYIESFIHNWDIERIAFMDKILVLLALVEIKTFPEIPVKVSLDEYIEISKYYSSMSSGNFVNGILDKIIGELKKENKINKLS